MDWKTMLTYISGSVDEELLLRNEYLVAENRVLRNQLRGRLRLTDAKRPIAPVLSPFVFLDTTAFEYLDQTGPPDRLSPRTASRRQGSPGIALSFQRSTEMA